MPLSGCRTGLGRVRETLAIPRRLRSRAQSRFFVVTKVAPMATAGKNSHIPSLDGLRAVSILLVLTSHAGLSYLIPGGFGVTVFFFLSGFLITSLLTREYDRHEQIAFGAFYLRRLLRLGPPLLLTMAAAIALVVAGIVPGDLDPVAIFSQIFFFFNYYFLAASTTSANGLTILWSLSIEEHFYLIWPALFVALAQRWIGFPYLIGLLALCLIWRCIRVLWLGATEWEIYSSTDTRFDSMLFGCLLALLSWKGDAERFFPANPRAMYSLIALAIGLLFFCLLYRDDIFRSTLRYTIQGLALMPIFYYAVNRPDALIFQPLNWPVIRQIGVWSYTIYLCHYVVIHALNHLGLSQQTTMFFTLLVLALSSAWAALVYELVERPLFGLRKRMTGHGPKPGSTNSQSTLQTRALGQSDRDAAQ